MKTIQKSKEEALLILCKNYGKETMVIYSQHAGEISGCYLIDADIISACENDFIKSFQILLRSIDEMTEEEKLNVIKLIEHFLEHAGNTETIVSNREWDITKADIANSSLVIDYLDSIGIDTRNLKDLIIEIK